MSGSLSIITLSQFSIIISTLIVKPTGVCVLNISIDVLSHTSGLTLANRAGDNAQSGRRYT